MTQLNETVLKEIVAIEAMLSSQVHELANILNEMLLEVAVIQATGPEAIRPPLEKVQRLGQKTSGSLQAIHTVRSRLRQLIEKT